MAMVGLVGCGGNGGTVPVPAPVAPSATRFSFFTENVLGQSADSTPVQVNDVVFDFDVNDDPTAFAYVF
jgi:hypothetical protein